MMPQLRGCLGAALVASAALSCVTPTDGEKDLQVSVTAIPDLLLKDSLELEAEVVDGTGAVIEHAVVRFRSSDVTVFSVDSVGLVRALSPGTATLIATAVEFEDAEPFTQDVRVRANLEVDSIRPANVRFGDVMEIYGVGLDTAAVILTQVGGVDAVEQTFEPVDSTRPQGEGVLRIWVPPPAPRRATVNIIGFAGVVLHPDTVIVAQRDLYEPNDTVPAALGTLPGFFRNPALAFEREIREEGIVAIPDRQPADWYTFQNPVTQDRTILFFSENVGAQSFGVFLTDSLRWRPFLGTYDVGPDSWTVGLETYLCGGLEITQLGQPVEIAEVLFPLSILAIKDLPAGSYHILAPFFASGQAASYELAVSESYISVLPPDAAEENDYCDVAPLIGQAGGVANLTIDNPHDIDWFRFSVPGLARTFSATVSTTNEDADLDLYLAADFRPDSLVLVDVAADAGVTETLTATLPAGDYFLVVVDHPGEPANYTLTSTINAASASEAAAASLHVPGVDDHLRQLRRKRAAYGPGRSDALKPRPRNRQ